VTAAHPSATRRRPQPLRRTLDLLPLGRFVATEERDGDDGSALLTPAERPLLEGAVPRRVAEFATARACARAALRRLGLPDSGLLPDGRGYPDWGTDAVGSITHCPGFRGAAVARRAQVPALGIDAEPNAELPAHLLVRVATPDEAVRLDDLERRRPAIPWGRLLFSAKESVYKAWYPATRGWLDFADVAVRLDADRGLFSADIRDAGGTLRTAGSFVVDDAVVVTAVAGTIDRVGSPAPG
jgi:4'-phosphopantetheinyl transferase EntD